MKLVILLSLLLNLKFSIAYFFSDKISVGSDFNTFEKQSFLEKSNTMNEIKSNSMLHLETFNKQRISKQYKTKVYLLNDKDPIGQKANVFHATVKLTDSLEIFENQKLTRKISFLE